MPIRNQRLLCAFAILLAFLVAGCTQQSSSPQTLSSSSPANSSASANATAPVTATVNSSPAINATASSSDKGAIDACKLLTGEEIKSIQSDNLKNTTLSPPGSSPFITSQCFYTTSNFVNSVSLKVTQQSSSTGAQSIREFWKERFGSAGRDEKEGEKERERERNKKARITEEEEEEREPPERVTGIGEEAYAVGNAKMGALYVLQGDKFLRISVGGSLSQSERIKKMKTLAQYVMKRI